VRCLHTEGELGGARLVCLHTMYETRDNEDVECHDHDLAESPTHDVDDGLKDDNVLLAGLHGGFVQARPHIIAPLYMENPYSSCWCSSSPDHPILQNVVYLRLAHPPAGPGRTAKVLQMLKTGEPLSLREPGSTGKTVKLTVIQHFHRTRILHFGEQEELRMDHYVNLHVAYVSSWESFDLSEANVPRRPTQLTTDEDDQWSLSDDKRLLDHVDKEQAWKDAGGYSRPDFLSISELAESLGKPEVRQQDTTATYEKNVTRYGRSRCWRGVTRCGVACSARTSCARGSAR
jgi:hypothetical protein